MKLRGAMLAAPFPWFGGESMVAPITCFSDLKSFVLTVAVCVFMGEVCHDRFGISGPISMVRW